MNLDTLSDRILGLFIGLGTGDLIGGPTAMNIIFAESLLNLKQYNREDLKKRYIDWLRRDAFDTGFITGEALSLLSRGIPDKYAIEILHKNYPDATAGCNPVHRAFPLAAASFISENDLANFAIDQASLTHYSKIAGDVAAACVILVRHLIKGESWQNAKQLACKKRMKETCDAILNTNKNKITPDGYSIHVLNASIYFLDEYHNFQMALENSIKFAGNANYCPVVVGAIGGARWGAKNIPETLSRRNRHYKKLEALAKEMLLGWNVTHGNQ